MDQEQIDQAVKRVLDMLLEKLIATADKQHVLMLFSGAGSGYMVGMQAIEYLAKGAHSLTVVMTASARHVIGEANVLRRSSAVHLIGDNEWVNTPKLVREVDLVLVPTLSMNTAAHLALGLMDSLIATLTLGSLLAGKPVLAVCDGANPYGNGGRVFGESNDPAPVLRAKMADNLTTLMNYGIQLVQEEDFLFRLVNQLYAAGAAAPTPAPAAPTKVAAASNGGAQKNGATHTKEPALQPVFTTRPGEIITASELMLFPPGAIIRLSAGAKLTPLAQEAAFRKELKLVYE